MEGRVERDGNEIPHQHATEGVVDDRVEAAVEGGVADDQIEEVASQQLEDISDVAVIADLPAPSPAYVEAEALASRNAVNKILETLRDAGLIPSV